MSKFKGWNKISFILLNGSIGIGFMVWLLSMAVDIEIIPGRVHTVVTFASLAALLVIGAAITAFRCRNEGASTGYAHEMKKYAQGGLWRGLAYALVAGVVVVGFTLILNHFDNPFHRMVTIQLAVFGLSVSALMLLNQYWMRFTYRGYFNEAAVVKVKANG